MVTSGRSSVITPHLNEELQAGSLISICPSPEHVKGLLHAMLTCPFSANINFLRAVSGFLFGGAGWWRVVNKTNGLGPADDFFQLSLPNLLYALYLYHVSNLKAPAANELAWGPEAGPGVNGHTWALQGCRCRSACAHCRYVRWLT